MKLQVPCNRAWSLDSNFNSPATQHKQQQPQKTAKKSECIDVFHIDNAVCILHAYENTAISCQPQAPKKSKTNLTASEKNKTEQ